MIRVDYAGPGGACEGLRSLGLTSIGIEWGAAECATRAAAAHATIRADLATYRPHHESLAGYWSSPPCQTFSSAGTGAGRDDLDRLGETILAQRWDDANLFDDRTRHVIDAARVAATSAAEWIAMEQVPGVLPLWAALAVVLQGKGYATWHGVLNAADYGVPQTRRRAFLMASRTRCVNPPARTHDEYPSLWTESWIPWGEALAVPGSWAAFGRRGEGMTERHGDRPPTPASEPYPAVTTGAHRRHWLLDRRTNSRAADGGRVPTVQVSSERPAPTLTGMAGGQWVLRAGAQANATVRCADQPAGTVTASADNGGYQLIRTTDGERWKLTVAGALILQGFAPTYPVVGTVEQQFRQVGNAVPPPLAAAVVRALTGSAQEAAA